MLVHEVEPHQPRDEDRDVELPDHRLAAGEGAGGGIRGYDVAVSESPDSANISHEEDKCKEVKKMIDEVNQVKSK